MSADDQVLLLQAESVALFALASGAMSDHISALTLGAVQGLNNHDVTRLAEGLI